jgi:hypothetical protein
VSCFEEDEVGRLGGSQEQAGKGCKVYSSACEQKYRIDYLQT